jgi:type IV pilus assembly protein PilM
MGLIDLLTKVSTPARSARASRVVGIDIGTTSVKVVELEDRDGVITLTTYGELQLGPYAEKPVGQIAALTNSSERQAIVDILRESAVQAKSAVLSIPLATSFVTNMTMQAGPDEDIGPRVRVDARKYIPISIADVTLDWAELDTESDERTRSVLIAAIQNEALKRFTALLQAVEFAASPTEIECFSAIRATYTDALPEYLLIDVGASTSKLYIVKNGLLQRMHRVPAGSIRVTEKIAEVQQCTFEEAEAIKRAALPGTVAYEMVQKCHQAILGRVLKEFAQVLQEYESIHGGNNVPLVLIGGGVTLPGVDTYIAHTLSHTLMTRSVFDRVAYPAFMEDALKKLSPVFATALGAALREFD